MTTDQQIPHVTPLHVDERYVTIRCPYCGKKHLHGSRGGTEYAGHRVAHCDTRELDNLGYIITEPPGGQPE